jgi:hypothetical protein
VQAEAFPVVVGRAVGDGIGMPMPVREPELTRQKDVTASLELRRLAAELAPMVGVWERLLAQHVPDRAGRCRTCTKGGTGLPSTRWPCSIHGIADLARRRFESEQH